MEHSTTLQLTCLREKPTSEKLDMLYRKALYIQAINLAETQKLDDDSVADIHRQFGDHLYGKSDYDGAMQQYVQTIGHLQPSYVIRKVCLSLFFFPSVLWVLNWLE
jgi:vacuolar protein sorting-associated protein 11